MCDEVYLKAFDADVSSIKYIPERIITREMCIIAITSFPYLYSCIPQHLKTPEIENLHVLHSQRIRDLYG